jgi:hypothetical protein
MTTVILAQPSPPANSAGFNQPTGFAVISGQNHWELQRKTIRAARADFIRLPVTAGFGNTAEMVDDLIEDGVTHIVFAYEGCPITYNSLFLGFIGGHFQIKAEQNQHIQFYLEIGNEPDIFCPTETPDSYRTKLLDLNQNIRKLVSFPNMQFVAGLGVRPAFNRALLSDGTVFANFDAVSYHIYAHENFADVSETWGYWKHELSQAGEPVLLTEVGINGDIGDEVKAQKYRDFALQQPSTTKGIAFWTVDPNYFEPYWITEQMGYILAGNPAPASLCFEVTRWCVDPIFVEFYTSIGLDFGDPGTSERESVHLWGYPLGPAYWDSETGHYTQVFERMVFEHHPNNQPPYTILLRRLGAEWER